MLDQLRLPKAALRNGSIEASGEVSGIHNRSNR
jgi:hypothetical protein